MQMYKPSYKHKTESGMISMSDGNQKLEIIDK
jgi:hypothetical protein